MQLQTRPTRDLSKIATVFLAHGKSNYYVRGRSNAADAKTSMDAPSFEVTGPRRSWPQRDDVLSLRSIVSARDHEISNEGRLHAVAAISATWHESSSRAAFCL